MKYPQEPAPGTVVYYEYLWAREAAKNRERGIKPRPCLVLATQTADDGGKLVWLLPITASADASKADYKVPIDQPTRDRLRLGAKSSEVVATEYNLVRWPPDGLHPIGRSNDCTYGRVGKGVFQNTVLRFKQAQKDKVLAQVLEA